MNKVLTKTKILIIIAIAVLLLLLSLVSLFAIIVNKGGKNSTSASYTITDNAVISNSNYNANSVFEIGSKNGLKGFAATVSSGKDFYGKTVKLTSDIRCKYPRTSYEMPSIGYLSDDDESGDGVPNSVLFRGTFDGQGYRVYSFLMKFNNPSVTDDWGYGYDGSLFIHSVGFFAGLGDGGKIKNLELDDFELRTTFEYDSEICAVGGLVGYIPYKANDVKIENCVVNGLKITKSDNFKGTGRVGGLVGLQDSKQTSAVIENCYVGELTLNVDSLNATMIQAGGLVGSYRATNPRITMVKSVFNSADSTITFTSNSSLRKWNNICCISQWGGEKPISSSIPTSCYSSTSGNFSELPKSSNGGETDGTNYWYYDSSYCSQYSNGFPLLRNSITWKTYTINANEGGSVNKSSLIIPSKFSSALTDKFTDSKYNQQALSVGEQSVIATPTAAYDFLYYSISGTTITANFQRRPVNIRFNITANSHYIVTLNGNNQTSTLSYTVDYGTVITATYSIYQAKYEFTANGNTYSIIYQCNDNRYCIEKSNNQTITVIQETEFEPNFILKEYDVVFR